MLRRERKKIPGRIEKRQLDRKQANKQTNKRRYGYIPQATQQKTREPEQLTKKKPLETKTNRTQQRSQEHDEGISKMTIDVSKYEKKGVIAMHSHG